MEEAICGEKTGSGNEMGAVLDGSRIQKGLAAMRTTRPPPSLALLLLLSLDALAQRVPSPVFLRRPLFRSQRASNAEFVPYLEAKNGYYTRPEDFSVPNYRPASPIRTPFPLKDNFNPKAYELPPQTSFAPPPSFRPPPYQPQPVSPQQYQPPPTRFPSPSPQFPPSPQPSPSRPASPLQVPYSPSSFPSPPQGPPPSPIYQPVPPASSFYRPPGGQGPVYSPPAHIPDNYAQQLTSVHVNPANTSGRVPIDTDQVSFYSPQSDGRKGPVLVISNAAKGDAARNGYRPPPPPPKNPYEPPPPPPREPENPYFTPPPRFESTSERATTRDSFQPTPPPSTQPPPTRNFGSFSTTVSYETDTTANPANPYESGYTSTPGPITEREKPSTDYSSPAYPSYEPPGREPPTTSESPPIVPNYNNPSPPPKQENPYEETPAPSSTQSPPELSTHSLPQPPPTTPPRFVPPQQFSRPTPPRPWPSPPPSSESPHFPEDRQFPSRPPLVTLPPLESFPTPRPSPPPRIPPSEFTARTISRTPYDTTTFIPIDYTSQPPFVPRNESKKVPNRVRGKAHVLCLEDGIELRMQTLFPFSGQIHAKDKLRVPQCSFTFKAEAVGKVFFPYKECGIPNSGDVSDQTKYHMQIIVTFEQEGAPSTIQSFIAQCEQQKILYNKQTLPRRIEEALEELRLVPIGLEQKAPIPQVHMKVLREEEHGHGHAHDEEDVDEVDMGQPLRLEWKLLPETDAYGFHVRNCTVKDAISGVEHLVIDDRGCSTDLNILGHPHYDTYHDVASSHFHAFKVPDTGKLALHCQFLICTNIPNSASNLSSCDTIPSVRDLAPLNNSQPPFCPDLITSPTNSILYDAAGNAVDKRSSALEGVLTQDVHAEICLAQHCDPLRDSRVCVSRTALSATTGLSLSSLAVSAALHVALKMRSRRVN